jgi:hypothetical protein
MTGRIGILGGTGWLGQALGLALLRGGIVAPGDLVILNRSGAAPGYADFPGVTLVRDTMLKTRIIPCLDVADGRVVKGVNFVDLVDAGDPVEPRAPMTRPARTSCVSSTSTPPTKTAARCSTSGHPHGRAMLHAADRGRRRAHAIEDVRALLLAGADKVSINSAAVADPDVVARSADRSAASASWSRSTPRPWRRAGGRSSPTAAASPPASTRSSSPARSRPRARAKSC